MTDRNTTNAGSPTSLAVSVYRFLDADGRLLYAGITRSGQRRFRKHAEEKDWWPQVTRIDVEHYPTATEAVAREREIIQTEHPVFNRQHWVIELHDDEVSVDEASRILGISSGAIRRLARAGTLAARTERVGSAIQYAIKREAL